MNNKKCLLKVISIILLTIFLISTSVVVIADKEKTIKEVTITRNKEFTNDKNDDLTKNSDQTRGIFVPILRGWATGNASSGKPIGFRGKIAKIKFDYLKIERFVFFRWEKADFWNATAIFFNVNQPIPKGSFDFKKHWVVAIVF